MPPPYALEPSMLENGVGGPGAGCCGPARDPCSQDWL